MPTCKNDCKRYYRGDEPSPKGLGYCAHAEKINKRRKGRDGKFWVVKAIKLQSGKRIRRWTRVKKAKIKKRKAMTRAVSGGGFGLLHTMNMRRKHTPKTPKQPKQPKIPTLRFKTTKIAKLQIKLENGNITPSEENTLHKLSKKYRVLKYLRYKYSKSMENQEKVENKITEMKGNPFDDYESIDYSNLVTQET